MGLTVQPFFVVLAAIVATAVSELLCWIIVYRTGSYRRLKDELDKRSKKLEAIKQTAAPALKNGKSSKKEKRVEENIKTSNKDMAAVKMKVNGITAITMLLAYQTMSSAFNGLVVAKLPFHPPGFMQAITHRGVVGDDITDCAAAFIYAMTVTYLKVNIAKAAPWSPSRATTRLMAANTAFNPDKFK